MKIDDFADGARRNWVFLQARYVYKEESELIKLFSRKGLAKLDELYFPEENISWQSPWWNLKENSDVRLGIQEKSNKEIGPKHPLWGL